MSTENNAIYDEGASSGGESATYETKIYVYCSRCVTRQHTIMAVAEDGTLLAARTCSDHGFAKHDMGVNEGTRMRDRYAANYPKGFEVIWVDEPKSHAGLQAALERSVP